MEQAQPLSKGKSPGTLLSGDAGREAARISNLSILEAKLSNGDHRGPATPINLLNSLEKAPRKKPSKRNFDNTLAAQDYGCKYCEAKFSTLQSLGGHQNSHKHERAAKKRARVMTRTTNAFSRMNLKSNTNWSGMQAKPVPGQPIAYGPRTRPSPADVVRPAHKGTPKPGTKTNPRALASHRPAMANPLNGILYQPVNHGDANFGTRVSPQTTGPRPLLANVLASGSSFSAQEIENEGLDLTLRL
ncbi:uncharacterized protein J3R85_012097 [Psidium guajava]|nr:uncharacterized protein J3R85_012097 [Psidium guajava]